MKNNTTVDVAIIGMGYVGLSLARVLVDSGLRVTGIDVNLEKVRAINEARSPVVDVSSTEIERMFAKGFFVGSDFRSIRDADTVILALPTPIGEDDHPDLSALRSAVSSAAPFRKDGQLWILESTVLPGVTEGIIAPELLSTSSDARTKPLLAYSPERVDPGSISRDLTLIPKIVAGRDTESLERAVVFYTRAGFDVVPAASIREAEAAKLLENTYRAVNMALVNELVQQFTAAGIDFLEVVRLAETKPFGFEAFWPGPGVGGHCIPVDPWYLQSFLRLRAEESAVTAVALEVNRRMPEKTAQRIGKIISSIAGGVNGTQQSVTLLGMTYKRNVNDFRESPGPKVAEALIALGISVFYHDPYLTEALPGLGAAVWLEDLTLVKNTAGTVVVLQEHREYSHLEQFQSGEDRWFSAAPGIAHLGQSIWAPGSEERE